MSIEKVDYLDAVTLKAFRQWARASVARQRVSRNHAGHSIIYHARSSAPSAL